MRPVIAELLRTCVHHVPLLLRVERSIAQEVAAVDSRECVSRLYLTDDQLIIQALLLPDLEVEVQDGDVLKIHKYKLRKATRKGQVGHVVFLAIQDCDVVKRVESTTLAVAEELEGGFIREGSTSTCTTTPPSRKRSTSELSAASEDTIPPPSKQPRLSETFNNNSIQDAMTFLPASQLSDDFESVTPDIHATQKRRLALRELDPGASPHFKATPSKKPQVGEAARSPSPPPPIHAHVITPLASLSSPCSPIHAPIITPLASLPGISPSTPVTVLVAITWTGQTLLRPSPAFPAKRHFKLHDVSIGHLFSGVSIAVYIDAANFKPERGTVALLQDVVVQRCGTGSGEINECFMLNAYANIPTKLLERGVTSKWFIHDEHELEGMGLEAEVDELKDWWDQREAKRSALGAQSTIQGKQAV